MVPSIGRIVHYRLSASDVTEINRQRTSEPGAGRGGNSPAEGHVYPAMIVRVWSETPAEDEHIQLQVFLDGNDAYWATSRHQGDGLGEWFAPPRV